jgi:hypothetical protein
MRTHVGSAHGAAYYATPDCSGEAATYVEFPLEGCNATDAEDIADGSEETFCTADVPICAPTAEPTQASDSSSADDDELSDGAVAGIVIGVMVGAGITAFAIYYFVYIKAVGGDTSKALLNNAA